MTLHFDPAMLARLQFGFTISFHILFPAFTIGLASWLAVVEWRWLKTGDETYRDVYQMWVKIFAVTFGMGVMTNEEYTVNYQTLLEIKPPALKSIPPPKRHVNEFVEM